MEIALWSIMSKEDSKKNKLQILQFYIEGRDKVESLQVQLHV